MSRKLNYQLQAVRKTLWETWDPIGVNGNAECITEYDSYAPSVVRMLLRGCTPAGELETHLARLETDMGLQPRPSSARVDAIAALRALRF
jgi:hypothetical protein